MPRSLETKAALEVNAGMLCLAGVTVFPHCYVAVPLIFEIFPKAALFRRPFIYICLQVAQLFGFCDDTFGDFSLNRRKQMSTAVLRE